MKKMLHIIAIILLCNIALCNAGEAVKPITAEIAINLTQMLDPTNESGSEKMYEPTRYTPPLFIVLHYTDTTTVGQTVNTYYDRGVSAHFTIDKDGVIYKHVADGNVAYHAGVSFWRGKYSLNWYSVGIEQINTGWDVNAKHWKEPRLPIKEADGKEWETWSEEQIKSAADLVKSLTDKYNIKPWNIIGHSDCACNRKVDPGPLYPWKKLHDDYGVGFWPDEDQTITKELAKGLDRADYMWLLHIFGYSVPGFISSVENIEELKQVWPDAKIEEKMKGINDMSERLTNKDTISAFQYHYMQDKFDNDPTYLAGTLDDDTQIMILRCVKSIIKNVDANDYSLRVLKKIGEKKLSAAAKKMINSFDSDQKLDAKLECDASWICKGN